MNGTGTKIRPYLIMIGKYKSYAIISDEIGQLFYKLDKNETLSLGEFCEEDNLFPIDNLDEFDRQEIIDIFGDDE